MVVNSLVKATVDLGPAFSAERLEYALKMTLLGLGAVFAVLTVIWFILVIFKFFLYDLNNANKQVHKAETKTVEPISVKQTDNIPKQPISSKDDATVAAIMAAISAYISDNEDLSKEYAGGFRVVSFKRVRAKATWNNNNK